MKQKPKLPSADRLLALADALEAFREEYGSELNTYEIQLRTAANILSGVGVPAYLHDVVIWAESTLTDLRAQAARGGAS